MGKFKKTGLLLFILEIVVIITAIINFPFNKKVDYVALDTSTNYGIKVKSDGKMYLNNSYFKAMGLNGFSFVMNEDNSQYKGTYVEYFKTIKKYKIPFIRVTFGGWGENLYTIFDKSSDHHEYFEMTDRIIKEAEKNNVGIIIDFFWYLSSLQHYNNEYVVEMANPNSKTMKFEERFVKAIIERYKSSPAVWGYEIGNEYNIEADLTGNNLYYALPGANQERNHITTEELASYYANISNIIKNADGTRLITTGDSMARPASYVLYQSTKGINYSNHTTWQQADYSRWNYPGADNYKYMIEKLNSGGSTNAISLHLYRCDEYCTNISMNEIISAYESVAATLKKPLYVGEFWASWANTSLPITERFAYEVDTISNSSIQLSSPWLCGEGGSFLQYYPEYNDTFLSKIKSYNNNYQQVFDNAWKSWKKSITVNIGNGKYTITRNNSYDSENNSYYLAGDNIKINIQPNSGYTIKSITVKDKNNNVIQLNNNQFTMPNSDVQITIELKTGSSLGDVNGDGKISIKDYMLIRKHILGTSKLNSSEQERADVNKDNKINHYDYMTIRKNILYGTSISTEKTTTTPKSETTTKESTTKETTTVKTQEPTITILNGWKQENGIWYYYINNAKAMGWQQLDWNGTVNWYYFNSSGVMQTGWQQLSWGGTINWYYFNSSGVMQKGWQQLEWNGLHWFYFDESTGAMVTGCHKLSWGGTLYDFCFNSSGVCTSGPGC